MAHDTSDQRLYGVHMVDGGKPNKEFGDFLRKSRDQLRWTREDLALHSGIPLRTLARWEAGEPPALSQIRGLIVTLNADPRQAVVALGLVTIEELGMPAPAPVDPALAELQRYFDDPKIPLRAKQQLKRGIRAARDLWFDWARIRAPKEPAARKSAAVR